MTSLVVNLDRKQPGIARAGRCRGPCSICHVQAGGQVPSVEVAAVEDVLLWKEPWLTAKVLSLGLYILICLRQLVSGMRLHHSCAPLQVWHTLTPKYASAYTALAVLHVSYK